MGILKDFRIRWKLLTGFGIVIIFSAVLAVTSIYTVKYVNKEYSYLLSYTMEQLKMLRNIGENFANMRRTGLATIAFSENAELVDNFYKQNDAFYEELTKEIDDFIANNNSNTKREQNTNDEQIAKILKMKDGIDNYKVLTVDKAVEYIHSGKYIEAAQTHMDAVGMVSETGAIVGELIEETQRYVDDISGEVNESIELSLTTLTALAAGVVLMSALVSVLISRMLEKPLKKLVTAADNISAGNLDCSDIAIIPSKDEIGRVGESFQIVADVFRELIDEVNLMSSKREKGDIDFFIDSRKFKGSYKMLADDICGLVRTSHEDNLKMLAILEEFERGNFDAEMPKLPGKKAIINQKIDAIRANMKGISGEISELTVQTLNGNLSARTNAEAYSGDWRQTLVGLNRVIDTVLAPLNETIQVLDAIADGNFEVRMKGEYKGDFANIKVSLNKTISNISAYIREIAYILSELAKNNLDLKISANYVGSFSIIKDSINEIVEKQNSILKNISSAADLVSTSAKQLSESSVSLAQGTTEQASSVEELNASLITINEKSELNAVNSGRAKNLSDKSNTNAQIGNEDMRRMLVAMEDIKQSSNNINQIIKTIEDIAFQTNLLALNAAVEAARAGASGKGFAVVAGEVRNLAEQSKVAAQETTELILNSIRKVNEGMDIANQTARALDEITTAITEVGGIISDIATASSNQALTIRQVSEGVDQISAVVQSNAAMSQQSAAASEELSVQSELLKGMIQKFNLRK